MTETMHKIEELAKLVEESYKKNSIINSEIRIINPRDKDINVAYVQLAYHYIMPPFNENVAFGLIAEHFADGLKLSEIRYLIKKMEESQKDNKLHDIENKVTFYNQLCGYSSQIDTVTDIFVSVELFHNPIFYRNPNFDLQRGKRIKLGSKNVNVHCNNIVPSDKIFVLDSSGITWSQKKVKDMALSRKKDPDGLKLLTKEDDILQISAKINDDSSISFLMRLVVGVLIDPQKVRMINISKELLEEIDEKASPSNALKLKSH